MIGKVGKSRAGSKSGSPSAFGAVVNYIAREADHKERAITPGDIGVMNLSTPADHLDLAVLLMDNAVSGALRNGRFKGDPVYHLILSWRAEDIPKPDQIKDCVRHTLKALGMQDCQAVWAIHRDTDDDHVHIAVNRVHPEKHTVVGPPRRDYFIIDQAMRELEIRHDFARDNGPNITVDGKDGPQIVRMSRKERLEKGLLNSGDAHGPRLTQAAKAAERSQGAPSFQAWAQDRPAQFLRNALQPGTGIGWNDLHSALARFGMVIQPKGSGMVVSTTLENGRVLACPVSKLDRNLTMMKLEQRLGAFTPAPAFPSPPAVHTYEKFLHGTQSGKQPDGPAPYHDKNGQRMIRRAERQVEREDLHARYQAAQQQIKNSRREVRQSLMARQKSARDVLQASIKASKPAFMAKEHAKGTTTPTAQSLWAYEAARAKEVLQKKHLKQRHALPRTMVWRDWLEQQAAAPIHDEAALAALRGIRYREVRKANQEKNGFEGEELEALKPILSGLHHEIDHRRQLIHYRNDHCAKLFTDTGPRIEIHDRAAASVEAALRIAAQKYGAVDITGRSAFREQAARQAARLGIPVRDKDLQPIWQEECQVKPPRNQEPQSQNPHHETIISLIGITPGSTPHHVAAEKTPIRPEPQKLDQGKVKSPIRRKPRRETPEMER